MKILYVTLVALALLTSCEKPNIESIIVDRFVVVNKWIDEPKSLHDEISPKYHAVLNNGDTIPCQPSVQIGDTTKFVYIKYRKH